MSLLSQSQLGIFYACQDLGEHDGNYQVPALWKLPGSIDVDRLKMALEQVVGNHPYILSRIEIEESKGSSNGVEGEFKGSSSGVEVGFKECSMDECDAVVVVRELQSIDDVRSTFCRTMDLLHDRLFRMEIYKTPDGNWLYLDFHHILIDGTAWYGLLLPEIDKAYRGEALAQEPMDGNDIANEEYQLRQSEEWQKQREWYMKEFGDAEEVDSMPTATSLTPNPSPIERGTEASPKGGGWRGPLETMFHLPVSRETIEAICQKYGVKESVVFTAAWGKMLANYTAEDRAFFTTIFTGRSDVRTRQTLTMMVHTLPVFMQMPSTQTIGDWLSSVRQQQKATREKAVYSFSDLHQDLGLRGDIMFGYHGKVAKTSAAEGFLLDGHVLNGEDLRISIPGITLDGQVLLRGVQGELKGSSRVQVFKRFKRFKRCKRRAMT